MADYTLKEQEWIRLSSIDGIGSIKFGKILNNYSSIGEALNNLEKDASHLKFINEKLRINIKTCLGNDKYMKNFLATLDRHEIKAITMFDKDYPEELQHIYDPPPVLYCKGDTELFAHNRLLAMIGTRRPTVCGRDSAAKIAGDLARQGVCIVSGLATGIDSFSHAGALSEDGLTIAILGCGVEQCYPAENKAIYKQILKKGLIVSEYIPGTPPLAQNFPLRNRIISGISNGVLVVEAAKRSGTLITIEYAQTQGKDVLAVPGNITSSLSVTPNILIREGAGVVLDYKDVMNWFGWYENENIKDRGIFLRDMDKQEQAVYNVIDENGSRFDTILNSLDCTPVQLMSLLSRMELREIIVRIPGNRYIKGF